MGDYTEDQVLKISKAYAYAYWANHSIGRFHQPEPEDILRLRNDYLTDVPEKLRNDHFDKDLSDLLKYKVPSE